MIETAHLPVVDVHSHPFMDHGSFTVEDYINTISFPGADANYLIQAGIPPEKAIQQVENVRLHTIYFRYFVKQMAAFFDCDATIEAVVEARNAAASDFKSFVRRLYRACQLDTMITDFGFPTPPLDHIKFREVSPITVVPLYRIETIIDAWIDKDVSWDEFSRHYTDTLSDALEHGNFKGLKSVIAYRTGLDLSPVSRSADQGRLAWESLKRGAGEHKPLRDHLFCRALEICMAYDVPLQVHTGMGDYDVNLIACRPALLMDLLRFPRYIGGKVLLVHTGYPYHAEAGYMANMLPNVYCDLSEGLPFAGQAARRIVSEVLEMAPLTKVMYGADGYIVPDIAYVGAKLGKQAVAQALAGLVHDGMLDQAEAQEAAGWILADNARRLYGLD